MKRNHLIKHLSKQGCELLREGDDIQYGRIDKLVI